MKKDDGIFRPLPLRREEIYQLIRDNGTARVSDLSDKLGVTTMTIRRDLETLELDGLIERTHGGAVAVNRTNREPLFTQKRVINRLQKDLIARKASSLIEDYDTVFLNSGTTTLRIFRNITAKHVKIVTNNAYFPMDDIPDSLEVISTGGLFRKESFTLIGETTLHSISQVFASKAFIGLDGFDVHYGMTTPVQPEAHVNRMMIEHTRGEVIVVADSSKIGKVSNFFVAPVTSAQKLLTDSGITDEQVADLEQMGIEVIQCE